MMQLVIEVLLSVAWCVLCGLCGYNIGRKHEAKDMKWKASVRESAILAIIAQAEDGVEIPWDELDLSEKAREYAEALLGEELEGEDPVVRRLRHWARDLRR